MATAQGIGRRSANIGLLCLLISAVLSACSDDPSPTASPTPSVVETPAPTPDSSVGTPAAEPAQAPVTPSPTPTAAEVAFYIVGPEPAVGKLRHQAVLLNDGRVLVSGGWGGFVEFYDPETSTWSIADPRQGPVPPLFASALRLSDDRLLIVGQSADGESAAGLFNPASDSWTAVPGPSTPRGSPDLVLLDDGRVLMAGGLDMFGLGSAFELSDSGSPFELDAVEAVEIFDPATGGWQHAASMNAVFHDQWFFLVNDGRVLAIAATSNDPEPGDPAGHAEIYDPVADTWTPVRSFEPYYAPTNAIQLSDGRVLVLGGLPDLSSTSRSYAPNRRLIGATLIDGTRLGAEQLSEAKIYDPATDAWTPTGRMAFARVDASLTLLPDGRVLAAGGQAFPEWGLPQEAVYSTTEIFDPVSNTWSPGPDLFEPRLGHAATLLPDGTVLLTGGNDANPDTDELASTEVIDPAAAPPAPAPVPTVTCEMTIAPAPAVTVTPATVLPAPLEILNAANDVMEALDSYHLEMAWDIAVEAEGAEVEAVRLFTTIDFQAPNRTSACHSERYPYEGEYAVQRIGIGDTVYLLGGPTGEWVIDEFSRSLAAALDFVGDHIIGDLEELSVDLVEAAGGLGVHRVSGVLAAAALSGTTLFREFEWFEWEESDLHVVYWVGTDDSLVRKFTAQGRLGSGEDGYVDISITVEVSRFGEEVAIEAPEVADASGPSSG